MAYVYLLRCADGSLYCGWTTDPERRLRQHNAGTASRYTKRRRPVEYALLKSAADRSAALREEARIKKLSRAEKLALLRTAEALATLPAAGLGVLGVGKDGRNRRPEACSDE